MEPIFDVPNRFFDDQQIIEKSCPENNFSESINKYIRFSSELDTWPIRS